ncbi:hypothetical protein E4U16_007846 [Claviceps sp. LM84 group G4]|nr:hypothetical protein E4U16_007846 [Claviceps sp. LM84 group G4]
MKTSFFLGAASAVASIGAASRNLVATQSRATDTAPLPGLGASPPKITPPPELDDTQQGLFKRAAPMTIMLAPDNTCGWISASGAAPYLCNSGDACGLVFPPLTAQGYIVCFHGERYNPFPQYVKCFDYSNYHASTDCGECHSENVVKCVRSDRPYCKTYYFISGGIVDFRCDSTSESMDADLFGTNHGVNWVDTTWAGQTGSRIYEKMVIFVDPVQYSDSTVSESTPKRISSERDSHKTLIGTTVSSLTTTSIATRRAPYGSSGLGYYRPPDINMGRNNSRTPIGAIVGGVVGGVASLVAVVLITFFYLRRRKRRTAGTTEAPPSSQPLMRSTASPEMSMTRNQASNDSNPNDGSESLQTGSVSAQQHQSGVCELQGQQHQLGVCELQGQQRQEPSVHELPSQISHNHRGQIHELA